MKLFDAENMPSKSMSYLLGDCKHEDAHICEKFSLPVIDRAADTLV